MIINSARAEEARVFDSEAGYHQFHDEETGETYGSFEVFWHNGHADSMAYDEDEDEEPYAAGWYWHACFPGCMPDGEPSGPFSSSWMAKWDADPWARENDPI